MAEEVSEKLRQEMNATFALKTVTDPHIAAFNKKLKAKTATQADVADYSARLGELLRDTLREVLTPEALPNETLYYNILRDTVDVMLKNAHRQVNQAAIEAQKAIDEAGGLGLNAIEAPYPQRRVNDLLYKAGAPGTPFDSAMKLLDQPVVTLTQAFYDDHIRYNADKRFRAGLAPKIIRTAAPKCCEWCSSLEGVYDYEDVKDTGNDVFRRHERCRCTVEYVCDGKRSDVWSKKLYEADKDTLKDREKYHTTTGDSSPGMLQIRSEYGIETQKTTQEEMQAEFDKVRKKKNNALNLSKRGENITSEYIKKARPGIGSFLQEPGIDQKENRNEISVANYLLKNFGGDIVLLKSNNKEKIPDYLWNGKLWDLKNPSTYNAVNKRVRTGLMQIRPNPGGIIVDLGDNDLELQAVVDEIDDRIRQSKGKMSVDIMILRKTKLEAVIRYK